MYLAPRWAFSAQAIDATGDARLAKGIHVRALLSDALGLPAAPLLVYRLPIDFGAKLWRKDVVWVDSHGTVLSYPFTVTPDNPVTGWLPPGSTCCWFSMEGAASQIIIGPPFPLPIGVVDATVNKTVAHPALNPSVAGAIRTEALRPIAGPVIQHPPVVKDISTPVSPVAPVKPVTPITPVTPVTPINADPINKVPVVVPPTIFNRLAAFQLDAVVSTLRGPAVVATRTGQPYIVAASHIEQVFVHGSGTVTDAEWVDAATIGNLGDRLLLWKQWSLPVHSGPRYLAEANPTVNSKLRTQLGAPTRHALYQEPAAANVASASAATPADELNRVTALAPDLDSWLQTLVSDTSADPWSLVQNFTVQAGEDASNPDTQGTASMPLLGMALQSIMDPGLARWAGFCEVDIAPAVSTTATTAYYAIGGIWALDRKRIPQALIDTLPPGSIFDSSKIPIGKRMPVKVQGDLPKGEYVELWVVAAAVIGAPGNPPSGPALASEPGTWMPSPPTAPIRQIPIDVSGLFPGALLAFARQDASGIVPLNPVDKNNAPMPIVSSPTKASTVSGISQVTDRKAPPGVLTYRLSQSDWFGRFSPWATVNAPDQARTAPPKPTPEVFYTPPAPAGTALLAGTLLVRVPIPADTALPPGCGPLTGLIVNATAPDVGYSINATYSVSGGGGATVTPAVAGPPPKPATLNIQFNGPALNVTASTTVSITAQWQTATAVSIVSDPVQRFIGDPRPAPPPVIPSALRYAAKPDAMNRARFEITLPAVTGAKYRVYFADENQLLKGLLNLTTSTDPQVTAALKSQATAALPGLTAALAMNATDRAAAFMAHSALYTYDMFQNLTQTAVAPGTFAHSLPGDLKTLSFYRILTWNAANVPSDFLTSPLVPVAVPNDPPPARPAISVKPAQNASGVIVGATVTVRVAKTAVDPVQYRVRRSFAGATPDPRRMLVIYEGALPAGGGGVSPVSAFNSGPNGVTFVHTDSTGIKSWHRYAWAVELRGGAPIGSPPGTTIHGDYGPPSKPASTMIVPPNPPDPVATFTGVRDGSGNAELAWTVTGSPVEMMSTDMGPHKFELYRIPAGTRPVVVPMATIPQAGADSVFHFTDPDTPAGSVSYRIVVIDPLGRASQPSPTVNLS
jgi:hypothetical protein